MSDEQEQSLDDEIIEPKTKFKTIRDYQNDMIQPRVAIEKQVKNLEGEKK